VAIEKLRDESILRFYDGIRREVEADGRSKHKFAAGRSVKEYADALREEMTKRRLPHPPIQWER
jgi:hypothetical protein